MSKDNASTSTAEAKELDQFAPLRKSLARVKKLREEMAEIEGLPTRLQEQIDSALAMGGVEDAEQVEKSIAIKRTQINLVPSSLRKFETRIGEILKEIEGFLPALRESLEAARRVEGEVILGRISQALADYSGCSILMHEITRSIDGKVLNIIGRQVEALFLYGSHRDPAEIAEGAMELVDRVATTGSLVEGVSLRSKENAG